MSYRRIALSAACLVTAALFGQEPECATNYHSDGKTAETFVMTGLSPKAVIERLPRLLIAAGATMQSSEPEKGLLKAEGLDVKAESSGNDTRVTFRLATAADKTALCRYASLVGNPPVPPVPQDPALIAQMKDELIKKQQITHRDVHNGLDSVSFDGPTNFLEFTIKSVKQLAADKREYGFSMLVPRSICSISGEDIEDGSAGFGGQNAVQRTKPVRVEGSLFYGNDGAGWHLTEATIETIESTK
jgi:hypothetical protein